MFLMLCSINWLNVIVWLPLLLQILRNMYIAICFPGCDITNLAINLFFLIKSLSTWKKKINKNLDNKKSFKGEVKNVFHRFQRTLSCQKLPQAWECAFNFSISSYFFIIVIINFYLFIYLFFACFKIIWILFLMLGVGLVIFSYFKYSAVVLFAFSLFTEMATSTWSLRKPRDSVFWRLIYQSV